MNFALAGIVAGLISFGVTPWVIDLARNWKLLDNPKNRYHPAHTHHGTVPRAGGLALFAAIAIAMLLYLPVTKLTVGIIVALALLTITGIIDDKRDINPYIRLGIGILAVIVVIGVGAGIPFVTNPITGGVIDLQTWRLSFDFFGKHSILVWADLFAFVWLMWTMHIVGWSAGVDGQMPGFVVVSGIVLGLLSLRYSAVDPSQLPVTILAFIVAGAFLGFLPWNVYPQKIMPGHGGKTIAGLMLGLLGILSYGKLGTALLVLGIPTIDALYTLIRRIGHGKSPVWADRGHLHHRLLDLGWGRRRVALFYWGVSAILGAIALAVTSRQKVFTLLLVGVVIGGFLLWLKYFWQFSKPHDPDSG
ncbi:hypothetical protein A2875_03025 [Candidatus Gottesmanbacteria bacterium RIFCSPHIGHO2_01_FULL_46_14]|uniref:Undecaprenyl-phosphate alpha-N-acetylglucosaminyl 1-phosphate transferase n=2 Tax=Candidatus Gottesmaniibacteriota TaxID=1752720 RepID=A0A1F5ZR39_9BACT|nr:MAG: hypothetical protein A2875_03025 [Candidatus Gottesmanbacteria bacterium RIFCSPHIGHO2_01_FULL_46_14]OGG30330.1 MAG: hypothetical protein A2971_01915 [Candidatus Gottesmanbacteria bacterium RIFCSPLOWO2_01_FULL_46_21]